MGKAALGFLAFLTIVLVSSDSNGQCRATFVYTGNGSACGQRGILLVIIIGSGLVCIPLNANNIGAKLPFLNGGSKSYSIE